MVGRSRLEHDFEHVLREPNALDLATDERSRQRHLPVGVANAHAEFVARDEVPAEVVAKEKQIQIARVIEEGKPEHIAERIVEGRIGKYFEEICLLEQKFVKDDSKTVEQMVTDAVAKIGENIKIRRFVRFVLGEGLEKKTDDLAAEVAKMTGAN